MMNNKAAHSFGNLLISTRGISEENKKISTAEWSVLDAGLGRCYAGCLLTQRWTSVQLLLAWRETENKLIGNLGIMVKPGRDPRTRFARTEVYFCSVFGNPLGKGGCRYAFTREQLTKAAYKKGDIRHAGSPNHIETGTYKGQSF